MLLRCLTAGSKYGLLVYFLILLGFYEALSLEHVLYAFLGAVIVSRVAGQTLRARLVRQLSAAEIASHHEACLSVGQNRSQTEEPDSTRPDWHDRHSHDDWESVVGRVQSLPPGNAWWLNSRGFWAERTTNLLVGSVFTVRGARGSPTYVGALGNFLDVTGWFVHPDPL